MRDIDVSPAIEKFEKMFYSKMKTDTKTVTQKRTTEIHSYAN